MADDHIKKPDPHQYGGRVALNAGCGLRTYKKPEGWASISLCA